MFAASIDHIDFVFNNRATIKLLLCHSLVRSVILFSFIPRKDAKVSQRRKVILASLREILPF